MGLGIARDAIDSFKSLASSKVPAIGTVHVADLHTVQQSLGKAEGLLRSARRYLYETLTEITTAQQAGAPVTEEDRAALRLVSAHCVRSAVEAVDLMLEAAGGTAVYETSRLPRCLSARLNLEMVGQYLLGGPLQVRR